MSDIFHYIITLFCYRNVLNHFVNYFWDLAIGILIRIKGIVFFLEDLISVLWVGIVSVIPTSHINSLTASAIVVIKILSLQCLNHFITYTLIMEIMNSQCLIFWLFSFIFLSSFEIVGYRENQPALELQAFLRLPKENLQIESWLMTERINAVK